ncbi:hypothetical protein GCM10010302_60170 [Streptomyces polychromogenes]|uniref:Uncharacterized protein n=1 Tax=Streptomyces polychromogenes TaxID=67342 RepID=A0ABP3FAJ9_9ACTN
MNAYVPLVSVADGGLLIPADEVTALLRRLAGGWLNSVYDGETDLDPGTALGLAGVLVELADQIDVECIGLMTLEGDADGEEAAPPA